MRIFTPSQTHIDDQALHLLHIGSNVVIAGPVTILTHDYSSFVCMRRYPERERAVAAMRSVTIGDNVLLGGEPQFSRALQLEKIQLSVREL